jgi:hypothetical protein
VPRSCRARLRIDENGVVVGVQHDDADAERVEAFATKSLEPVLTGSGLVVVVDGASPLGLLLRAALHCGCGRAGRPGAGVDQPRRDAYGEHGDQEADPIDPVHAAIVGSMFT